MHSINLVTDADMREYLEFERQIADTNDSMCMACTVMNGQIRSLKSKVEKSRRKKQTKTKCHEHLLKMHADVRKKSKCHLVCFILL